MCFSLVSFNLSPICTVPSRCETVWAWRRFYSCLHHRAITSHVFEPRLGRLISLNLFIFTLMRAYCNSLMHLMTCSGSSVGQRLPPFLACYCKFYSPPPPFFHIIGVCGSVQCAVLYQGVCSRSLQGSDGLQHALQFTTLFQSRHIAAASDTLLTDEHPRYLRSSRDKPGCNWFRCSR